MIRIKQNFVYHLFERLNKNYNYAVLRGYQKLPDNFESHDIDILVDKTEFTRLTQDIYELIRSYGYSCLMVNENERFVTFVIGKLVENKLDFLYLDFFFNYSLYGVLLIDADRILQRKIYNGKVYHVNLLDEFLEKFLNTSLLDQSYPDKYNHIRHEVRERHEDELKVILSNIFNDATIGEEKCIVVPGKRLLLKVLLTNLLRTPYKQVVFSLKFVYFYVKSWLEPNGFSFSISGPDGSGKTTILTALKTNFSLAYREVKMNHFRPTIIPRIAELLKKIGLKTEVDYNYSQPHRGGKTSALSSWVRFLYYIVDYIVGYFYAVKPVLFRRGIVIFDRYFTDIASDGLRSRIFLNYKTIFSFRYLVPSMNYNFIIFVKPELIRQRKQELTRQQIDAIYDKLNYVCDTDKRYTRISNDGKPVVAINSIINFILENQDKKYSLYFQ